MWVRRNTTLAKAIQARLARMPVPACMPPHLPCANLTQDHCNRTGFCPSKIQTLQIQSAHHAAELLAGCWAGTGTAARFCSVNVALELRRKQLGVCLCLQEARHVRVWEHCRKITLGLSIVCCELPHASQVPCIRSTVPTRRHDGLLWTLTRHQGWAEHHDVG